MTLKYESEILFDLMKRDGDDTPSDVLPYESELKEKYLQQVEGSYPKLQDYRPEWLSYNLYSHLPANFPLETLSNVTNATVDNVVPYAYGSASLKGQTLFNIPTKNYSETAKELSSWVTSYDESFTLKPNTKYYIGIFNYSTESKVYGVRVDPFTADQKVTINPNGYGYLITTTVDSIKSNALVVNKASHKQNNNAKFLFIEYQDGMENWDIPYFEGMKSVQMPGLKTTGKNLYPFGDINFMPTNLNTWYLSTGVPQSKWGKALTHDCGIGEWFYLEEGRYSISSETSDTSFQILGEGEVLKPMGDNMTYQSGWYTIRMKSKTDTLQRIQISKIQIEKCMKKTDYEPYQSNILTVNEPIELRGIGGVKDDLNLITGDLTQRIGEVVLDGSEQWFGTSKNYRVEIPNVKGYKDLKWGQKSVISNFYPPFEGEETDSYIISEWEGNQIRIHDVNRTLEELKSKLAKNPLHVIFILNEESNKTVDLTVTDQDGKAESTIRPLEGTMHLMTEGEAIKPLFSGEIPVEATTQNLMSFVNIEEEK